MGKSQDFLFIIYIYFGCSVRVDWSGRGDDGDARHDGQSLPVDQTDLPAKEAQREPVEE